MLNSPTILQKSDLFKIICLLRKGEILVLPTDTVYGLTLSLEKGERSYLIYQIKQRDKRKPLAIVVSDLVLAKKLGCFGQNDLALLEKYPPGKLTLIVPKKPNLPYHYLQELTNIGIRITNDEWLKKIIETTGPLLMTSWNISGFPPFVSPYQKETNDLIFGIVDSGILSNNPSAIFDSINKKWIR